MCGTTMIGRQPLGCHNGLHCIAGYWLPGFNTRAGCCDLKPIYKIDDSILPCTILDNHIRRAAHLVAAP
jgi:hypothetical protein